MGTVDAQRALASGLALASDEYFELYQAAASAAEEWGALLSQLEELQQRSDVRDWKSFASQIVRLRERMDTLAELVNANAPEVQTQVRRVASVPR